MGLSCVGIHTECRLLSLLIGFDPRHGMDAQVSTRLKLGVMWDHNGTYMDGIGFQYRDHQVTIDLSEDGQLAGE